MSANETTLHASHNLKKVNHYRPKYGRQHEALAHTEQQAIKGPKITFVKPFKRVNQRSNIYKKKRETLMNHINKQQLLSIIFMTKDSANKCSGF